MVWETIQNIAIIGTAIATIIGIIIALKQFKTNFEDSLSKEYRTIIKEIPIEALLGKELNENKFQDALPAFYSYIDLSNEEVFLRQNGRVSNKTWKDWKEGIQSNLKRPAFKKAWEHIKANDPKIFSELRKLENPKYDDDPKKWK